jgi:hypothetical protein
MAETKLPDDFWHTFVYVHFGYFCCGRCGIEPDLEWAWEGLTANDEAGLVQFTNRVVPHLKSEGWIVLDAQPRCPLCAAKNSASAKSKST